MAWYHVDCIQFEFYDNSKTYPWPHINSNFMADSTKEDGIGLIHIYDFGKGKRDICGNTVLEHELQRFHQDQWSVNWCNPFN